MSSSSNSSCISPVLMASHMHYDLDHSRLLSSIIKTIREKNQPCDVSLRINDEVLKAHRLILALTSPFFDAMFNTDMAEKSKFEIELHHLTFDNLQLLVEFSYTSKVLITEDNVQKLLSASSFLLIDSVQVACCTFMIKMLSVKNCLDTWRFAEMHSCNYLSSQSRDYALQHFETVAESEGFLRLSYSEIEQIVSEDKLCIYCEEQVYLAIIRWIKHDISERLQYSSPLFGQIRLVQMSQEFLVNVVYEEPLLWNDSRCNKMWMEAKNYKEFPKQVSHIPKKLTNRRLGGLSLFTIGGERDYTYFNTGERYDFVNNCWLPIAPMSQKRALGGIASLGCRIYAIGGHNGNKGLSSSECYDPINDKWSPVKSLNSDKWCGHGICVMDGFLYMCGGYSVSRQCVLSNVDRYDSLTDVWLSCPRMITPRANCCVSVVNNCLYAAGGYFKAAFQSTVEMYDPRMSKWMAVADMSGPRGEFSAASLDDTLYCVGGKKNFALFNHSTVLSSGERLDIRRNSWEPIANMQHGRAFQSMVAMNGELLVLGGYGNNFADSTEWYDPRNNQWTMGTPTQKHRTKFGAVLLYCPDMKDLTPASEN